MASRRRTPRRASSRAQAPSGPVSTSTAREPSRTKMASPCPTSSTYSPAGEKNTQRTTSTQPSKSATAEPRSSLRGETWGQSHKRRMASDAIVSATTAASQLTTTLANGRE